MREVLGQPKAIVPAAKTIGGPGTRLMVPLGHIHAAYVRSHFGTAEMTLWDAPRRDEARLRPRDGNRRPPSRAHRRPEGVRHFRA